MFYEIRKMEEADWPQVAKTVLMELVVSIDKEREEEVCYQK